MPTECRTLNGLEILLSRQKKRKPFVRATSDERQKANMQLISVFTNQWRNVFIFDNAMNGSALFQILLIMLKNSMNLQYSKSFSNVALRIIYSPSNVCSRPCRRKAFSRKNRKPSRNSLFPFAFCNRDKIRAVRKILRVPSFFYRTTGIYNRIEA